MTLYPYLQLQPIDPQDDGTVSELDKYEEDEIIDMSEDTDGEELIERWSAISRDMHRGQDKSSSQ